MSDLHAEIEALFLRFIYIEDAVETMDIMSAEKYRGEYFRWFVHEDALALEMGYKPDFGVEFQGTKDSREAAVNAAIGYIWACRRDLVAQCKKEASAGRAYRKQRAEGGSGMAIQ